MTTTAHVRKILARPDLERLLARLLHMEYRVYGPTVRDEVVRYAPINTAQDLPIGIGDLQEGGSYRLEPTADDAVFTCVLGPDSFKKYLFPPRETLFRAIRTDGRLEFESLPAAVEKLAFFAIRPCELAAIEVQDRVFAARDMVDSGYLARRENLLLVAVNCSRPAATCFCASLGTGPRARTFYDLALTEILTGEEHYFLLEAATDAGLEIIGELDLPGAGREHIEAARAVSRDAAQQQRALETAGLKETLYANIGNTAFWEQVAARCLNCANCTMVCPTCFCSTVEDDTGLDGTSAERIRYWDSCFNSGHSHIVGGSIRQSGASRYRQWLVHKLASWQDQFDTLGCVGCGRCITWCPVGIDITAEIDRLRADAVETAR